MRVCDGFLCSMSATYDGAVTLHSMQSCISDVKAWATANMLKLNDNKTELMLVTSKRTKNLHNLPTSITIGNAEIPFKQSVKNLGFALDCHLAMNAHVSKIARTCYFELRRLASIRRFLTSTATATLVSAFVLSRIDYCNSLLFGSTHDVTSHLQRIQNYSARVVICLPKSSRQAKHKVSKLVHSAKCKFYTERIALASSSKELHQIVNILSNRHPPKILPTIYPSADLPSIFIKYFTNKVEKLRANIASEHVTSTLVTGTTAATFSSFKKSVTINSEGMHS